MRYGILLAGALTLSGCTVPGMIVGAGATAGLGAAQERGIETAADDLSIQLEINRLLLAKDDKLFARVSTQVSEGRVLLTGVVDKPEERIAATRIAWGVSSVREVLNEIRVAEGASFTQATRDTAITAKLRAQIMQDSEVSAINYTIETVRGTIYLMGIAQNGTELTRVVNHARGISGVRNVISHIQLKNDPARLRSGAAGAAKEG